MNAENAAQYTYFLASISCFIFLITRSPKQHFWPNLIIFVLTVLLFLDEIAYGTETFNVKPYYWEKYNYTFHDLHNLITGLWEILNLELVEAEWDYAMFAQFLKMDLVVLGLLLLYWIVCRLRVSEKTETEQMRTTIIRWAALFLMGYALFSMYEILSLPADPKNIWLFGYSKSRILLAIFISLYIVFLGFIYFNITNSRQKMLRFANHLMNHKWIKIWTGVFLSLGLLVIAIYQFVLPFTPFPDYKAVFPRVTPIIYLMAISLTFSSFIWINWDGIFFRSLSSYKQSLADFLKRYPGYIYLGFAIVQILISTLIDKGYVSSEFIDWNLLVWVEESFELIASLELGIAGVTFRYNHFSSSRNPTDVGKPT